MAEFLDPEVSKAVRSITDHFVTVRKGTPVHEVEAKLKGKRDALADLEQQRIIRKFSAHYLPGLRAEEFEDSKARNYIRDCTAVVLRALRELYAAGGPKDYDAAEVLTMVKQKIDPTAQLETVTVGLLFATDFTSYFGGWSSSSEGAVVSVTIKADILDFHSFESAWERELARRDASREIPSDPVAQLTVQPPVAKGGFGVARYGNRWEAVRELGKGGQGSVLLAWDTTKYRPDGIADEIKHAVLGIRAITTQESLESTKKAHDLARSILRYGKSENAEHCGALKILHPPEHSAGYPEEQVRRMKREVYGLKQVIHPNIVRVLDEKIEERWFVTEYFHQGNLNANRSGYEGDLLKSLLAIRPLTEGVSQLHTKKLVHRDIKPENIFVSDDRGLVLGDFGLVYFADDQRSRMSDTYENVGSRDWMPGWAMGMRIEDIKPNFDVFCLGKLLWWMVSGRSMLRLWYKHDDEFELEKMFPQKRDIRWARTVLDKCIVEKEVDCLPSAVELLALIDTLLPAVERHCQVVAEGLTRICRVCGMGEYKEASTSTLQGLQGTKTEGLRIFICDYCGHTELFYFRSGAGFPAWKGPALADPEPHPQPRVELAPVIELPPGQQYGMPLLVVGNTSRGGCRVYEVELVMERVAIGKVHQRQMQQACAIPGTGIIQPFGELKIDLSDSVRGMFYGLWKGTQPNSFYPGVRMWAIIRYSADDAKFEIKSGVYTAELLLVEAKQPPESVRWLKLLDR